MPGGGPSGRLPFAGGFWRFRTPVSFDTPVAAQPPADPLGFFTDHLGPRLPLQRELTGDIGGEEGPVTIGAGAADDFDRPRIAALRSAWIDNSAPYAPVVVAPPVTVGPDSDRARAPLPRMQWFENTPYAPAVVITIQPVSLDFDRQPATRPGRNVDATGPVSVTVTAITDATAPRPARPLARNFEDFLPPANLVVPYVVAQLEGRRLPDLRRVNADAGSPPVSLSLAFSSAQGERRPLAARRGAEGGFAGPATPIAGQEAALLRSLAWQRSSGARHSVSGTPAVRARRPVSRGYIICG